MAIDRVFAAAYIDNGNQHKVLGVKLRPFCAWHLFLLQVVESPFINAGVVELYHLRRAVGICRLKFPDSRTKPPIPPLVINQAGLEREVHRFLEYVGDYLQKPEFTIIPIHEFGSQDRIPKNPSPPPESIQLVFDAAKGANVSLNEAWNMPIGQAYIAQAMYFKQQGTLVDFLTDKEREYQAGLKASFSTNGDR